jgi:hypothetical protein
MPSEEVSAAAAPYCGPADAVQFRFGQWLSGAPGWPNEEPQCVDKRCGSLFVRPSATCRQTIPMSEWTICLLKSDLRPVVASYSFSNFFATR